jgi:hypothetical protein
MKVFQLERIEGKGQASKNGYPTVNVQLELDSIDEGLWLCYMHSGTGWRRYPYKSISSVSIYKGSLCVEIHSLDKLQYPINVGDSITVFFIKKLRDKIKNINPIEQIKTDIDLAMSTTLKNCESCQFCYSQDYGYSNYTVEETAYGCYVDVFDESEDDSIKYNAEGCPLYHPGEMWKLDVDGEEKRPTEEWLKSAKRNSKLIRILK